MVIVLCSFVSYAASTEDDIGDVRAVGAGRPGTRSNLLDFDGPRRVEVVGDIGGLDVVRGVEPAVSVVIAAVEVVADDEQGAAWRDGS